MLSIDSARHVTLWASPLRLFAWIGQQIRQCICGLHGHDTLMHFEHGRMSLRCICGYESPGWEVKGTCRSPQQPVDATPHVVRMPLARERKVA